MMKFRSSLIALAALAAIGSAQALTPAEVVAERTAGNLKEIKITGASALRLALGGFIQADLAQPGTLDVFFNDANGANHRAYSFRLNTAIGSWAVGTPILITKRDQGGSGEGVGPLITASATQLHMKVDGACTAAVGGVSPATDIQKPGFLCSGTVAGMADAGLSDVEPALLEAGINNGGARSTANLDSEGFVQNIFGVAVNKKLYLALQKAQGLVDASATVVDEDAAKQPSLPVPFVRGALTGQLLGNDPLTKKGWNLVVPGAFDKKINVCRRAAGSGTQAASNVYFANNPCGGNDVYIPSVAGGTIAAVGSLAVNAGSSTGAVETCLGTTAQNAAGDAYALGVIGRENNPRAVVNGVATDKGYRFVKLNGVAPERANVINGSYEFVVESTMQWAKTGANAPTGEKLDLLKLLRGNMGKASVLAGLDVDFQAGLAASPSTIVGAWADLTPAVQAFTSHSSRKAAASCTPVRMTK
jgi:ABC-type phosphate transport system substrate-binding protein